MGLSNKARTAASPETLNCFVDIICSIITASKKVSKGSVKQGTLELPLDNMDH